MRILGIDYGGKRIGLSITDRQNNMAMSLCMLENDDSISENISKIIRDNDIGSIVIGKPLNLKGQPGHQAEIVENFISNTLENYGLPIFAIDERFTSKISAGMVSGTYNMPEKNKSQKHSKKKTKSRTERIRQSGTIDTVSAVLILEDYLNSIKLKKGYNNP